MLEVFCWQPVPIDHDISCLWSWWDETLVTDSDPIIGSWPAGRGQWMLCQRWDYPGLPILMSLTERITSEHSGGWCRLRPGRGHRGSGLQMWPLAESPPGMAVSLVWCVVSPCPLPCHSFSLLVSAAIPGCHLYLSPAPSCHGDTRWELSRPSRSQGANWSLTDSRADWPLWHPAHWVESGWVWCRDCVNSRDVNCQLKLLFLSKKNKNAINSVSNCCISILSFQGVSSNASLPHFCLFWLSIELLARVINCMLTHSRGVGWLPSFTIIEST